MNSLLNEKKSRSKFIRCLKAVENKDSKLIAYWVAPKHKISWESLKLENTQDIPSGRTMGHKQFPPWKINVPGMSKCKCICIRMRLCHAPAAKLGNTRLYVYCIHIIHIIHLIHLIYIQYIEYMLISYHKVIKIQKGTFLESGVLSGATPLVRSPLSAPQLVRRQQPGRPRPTWRRNARLNGWKCGNDYLVVVFWNEKHWTLQ